MKADPLELAVSRAAWKRAIQHAVLAERERCACIAETESEPEGPMPVEFNREKISDIVRGTVRATRRCIADRIRSGTDVSNGGKNA